MSEELRMALQTADRKLAAQTSELAEARRALAAANQQNSVLRDCLSEFASKDFSIGDCKRIAKTMLAALAASDSPTASSSTGS